MACQVWAPEGHHDYEVGSRIHTHCALGSKRTRSPGSEDSPFHPMEANAQRMGALLRVQDEIDGIPRDSVSSDPSHKPAISHRRRSVGGAAEVGWEQSQKPAQTVCRGRRENVWS